MVGHDRIVATKARKSPPGTSTAAEGRGLAPAIDLAARQLAAGLVYDAASAPAE
jgi:hypothetical protein